MKLWYGTALQRERRDRRHSVEWVRRYTGVFKGDVKPTVREVVRKFFVGSNSRI